MKLGIFADTHYCRKEILCRTRHPSLSLGKIKEAMSSFAVADVDLCICMGDLVDICDSVSEAEECITEVIGLIRSYNIQFVLIPGNHDYKVFSAEEFSTRTGCAIPPYAFDIGSHLLIMLDANYRSDNRRFDVAGVDWKDSNLPPEQLEFLYQTLAATDKPSIVLVHENLDTSVNEKHIIKNASAARKIIEQSGKVKLVIQGHYHPGADHVINGIRYLTVPAMCEGTENRYLILDI